MSQTAADVFCLAFVKSRKGHRHCSTTTFIVLGYSLEKWWERKATWRRISWRGVAGEDKTAATASRYPFSRCGRKDGGLEYSASSTVELVSIVLERSAAATSYRENGLMIVGRRSRDIIPYHRCSPPIDPALPPCVCLDPSPLMPL